jgi:hypothetical protein
MDCHAIAPLSCNIPVKLNAIAPHFPGNDEYG